MTFRALGYAVGAFAMLASLSASANEVTTYTYDPLGRLVSSAHAGTVNNGQAVTTSYDPAGNRNAYAVSGVGAGPSISIGNASANEGAALNFTVTRAGDVNAPVGVSWSTSNGSAVSGADYVAASGTVLFATGEVSKSISVATVDDSIFENSETMTVTLASPIGGATLGSATGTGTINDNDVAATIAIGDTTATEGGNLVFPVTRTGNTAVAVSASYSTVNGTATSGSDFIGQSSTVNFAAGQTSATISVPTINDSVYEPTETMNVTLSGASPGAVISISSATGTISDDDSIFLTSGSWSYDDDYGSHYYSGYAPSLSMGSVSSTIYHGFTIVEILETDGGILFEVSGSSASPNSGWNTITIPGVGTLSRSAASYGTSGNYAWWGWNTGSSISTGLLYIQ